MMNNDTFHSLKYYTYLLLLIVLVLFLLSEGRMLFIPLSFSFLISFILFPVYLKMEKYLGRMVGIMVCIILLLAIAFLFFQLIINSFSLLHKKFVISEDKILDKLGELVYYFEGLFGIDAEQQEDLISKLYESLIQDIFPLVNETVFQSAISMIIILLVPIFVGLILYYREILVKFVLAIVPKNRIDDVKSSINEMTYIYFRFAKGMVLVYFIVGILNSIGFLAIGLPNAIYLGLLASLLTFFPYVGIMIGGSVAIIVAWTTFDTAWQPLAVIGILSVVQYLEANLIFPLAVGHQLKINPLATLIAIIVGGIIWGGAGMILFVPFIAILKTLADRIDELKPLAIIIGEAEKKEKKPKWWFRKR